MSNQYQVLSERIYSDFPIFGSCIRQRAAVALSKDKSPHAVKILAEAVVRSSDRKVITIALEALRNLRDRDSVNAFCQVWAESRHKDLTTILKNRRYISTEPKFLVLSALKVGALDLVKKGDIKVLDPLLAAISDKDTQIASASGVCLVELQDRKVIDALCKRWIENPSSQLQNAIQKGNYAPNDANTRALFYFLMGDWQKYEGLDIDQKLLANAYKSSNKEIQDRVTAIARQAGRIELLKILADSKHGFGFDKITDKNLSTLIDILVANPDRKEIWRFLYNASPVWSKKLLHRIKESALENNFPADEKLILTRLFDLNQKFNLEEFKDSIFLYLNQIKSSSFMMPRPIHSLVILSDRETILLATTCEVIVWNLSKKQQLEKIDIFCNFEHKNVALNPQSQCVSGKYFIIYKAEIKTRGKYFGPYDFHYEVEESIHKSSLHSIEPSSSTSSDKFSLYLQDKFIDDDRYCLFGEEPTYWIDNDATETFDLTVAVSPNEKFLAVGGIANSCERKCFKPSVKVWSLSRNLVLDQFPHFNVVSLVFSQDSKILASGSKDGSINLINIPYLETDEQFQSYRKCFQAHSSCISVLAISPDSKTLASSCKKDRCIRLWSIPDAESLNVITTSGSITSLLVTPDSKVLVVGMEDADIGLWSIDGNFLQVLKGHTASITSLAVTPDGKTLISGSKDKTIRLWNLENSNNFLINELSGNDVSALSLKSKIPALTEGVRNAIKFTIELIRLRQQFDIDIEDSSNNIASSEFDIEIE